MVDLRAIEAWVWRLFGCLCVMICPLAAIAGPSDPTAASAMPYRIEWGVKIPLRDGVSLDATIFRPATEKPVPVILTLTPYVADRFEDVGAAFARAGYAFASVDDRGRGNSGGRFVLWDGEGRDGHDVVEWLARQAWSDGQVGMWGGSYGGKNQWMIAGELPKGLKTIVPASAGVAGENIAMHYSNISLALDYNWLISMIGKTANTNGAGDGAYWTGVYEEAAKGLVPWRHLDALAGYRSPIWQVWMAHPALDAFWDAASPAPSRYAAITLPTLSITGQYDTSETGTFAFRQNHLDAASSAVAAQSYLVIGPWNHAGSRVPMRRLGGLDFGPAAYIDVKALHVAWYDHVMKGAPLPAFLTDHVVYYLVGADPNAGAWRSAPTLAAATDHVQTLWLSSPGTDAGSIAARGALTKDAPPAQPADAYVYDPGLPAHNEGFEGAELVSKDYLTSDGLMRRLQGDGLVYDTAQFTVAADLVGFPAVTLFMSLDVPDTDVRAALYEVKADGSVIFLTQDVVRARYRTSVRKAILVTPGKLEPYSFARFNFVARTIAPGSVLRLVIVPLGASYHGERNRNSGKPVADETAADDRIAHVSVALGPGFSHIDLPWGR
jgi:putative CocE/NonD family hydrolase